MSDRNQRVEEIRERLAEYKKHRNDPYSYYAEEIEAVREMRYRAAEDIEFLLEEFDRRS